MIRPLNLLLLLAAVGVWTTGCQQQTPTPAPLPVQAGTPAAGDEDHGHAHNPDGSHPGEGGHGHAAGPHGGTVADWGGGKFHVEFTVDHNKQTATVYVLGSDEKTPAPIQSTDGEVLLTIKEPAFQVALKATPLDGESADKASRFVGQHESLGILREFEGSISAEVDGTPYAGDFKEEAEGEHGHAHGHTHGADDALVWEGEPKQHAGTKILLGYHGKTLLAGHEVEPAVSIERDGRPVADARVFNSLISEDGQTVLAKEVAAKYEPTTAEEPAHYALGGLAVPKDAKNVIIRFRVEIPGSEAATFDVPVAVH